MNRRTLIFASAATMLGAASWLRAHNHVDDESADANTLKTNPMNSTDLQTEAHPQTIEKWNLSKDEWQARLDEAAFHVLRKEGTERPFSSPLNDENREGEFVCSGCGLALFTQSQKFDSGTGWPSFFDTIDGHVDTKRDFKLIMPRTEYHCARCGGHQGHVFKDGPAPTGLRYCNNGVAIKFVPA
ncbi:hypothetical protein NBRC116583_35990 [Arenicella sp. 4NH20-0111]